MRPRDVPVKQGRTGGENTTQPRIERCTPGELAHDDGSPPRLYLPFLPHIEAPLCCSLAPAPLSFAGAGAPLRARPSLSGQNRRDGVIRRLPGGCQLALGRADRVAAWWILAHARILEPPHTHTHTDADICYVCVEKAAEFCQWLHLNPPSPRLDVSPRPLYVLIALAWLAVCF